MPDILAQVLSGLNVAWELQGTFQPRDYCVQYRETDFNFASRLMEEEGIYYLLSTRPTVTKWSARDEGRVFDWQKIRGRRHGSGNRSISEIPVERRAPGRATSRRGHQRPGTA